MGFLLAHSAWQIDQFPTCWPMNGLFVHWSRGSGVLSFSERLVKSLPLLNFMWGDSKAKWSWTVSSCDCFVVRPFWLLLIFFFKLYMTLLWWRFLAATKQLYEWYFLSVSLSVCPSFTPFWLCSRHRIIMKFSGVITKDQGKVHAKGQGQRSKVKVTEVTTQLKRFRTVTPVWIHIWWWNDTYSLK